MRGDLRLPPVRRRAFLPVADGGARRGLHPARPGRGGARGRGLQRPRRDRARRQSELFSAARRSGPQAAESVFRRRPRRLPATPRSTPGCGRRCRKPCWSTRSRCPSSCRSRALSPAARAFMCSTSWSTPRRSTPKRSNRCRTGNAGELVLTHLVKEAQPLVRYRTGDLTVRQTTAPVHAGRSTCRAWCSAAPTRW